MTGQELLATLHPQERAETEASLRAHGDDPATASAFWAMCNRPADFTQAAMCDVR